jgi:transposase
MLTKEEWLLTRDLHSKAFSISEISRVTGHDRKTVRKYLNRKTAPEFQKRPTRSGKLDPYKPYILKKLNESPYSTAYLLREIQKMGFNGGRTIVKDFVGKVRPKKGVNAVLPHDR